MTGLMIALYVISAIIGIILLVWFIITLNAIRRGIEEGNKVLWKIAKKGESENKSTAEKTTEEKAEEFDGLLSTVDRENLKAIEAVHDLKIFAVTKKEIEKNGEKAYRLELRISSDGIEPPKIKTADIDPDQYTKLELDKTYTREELELNSK